jgi:hypothetical protein
MVHENVELASQAIRFDCRPGEILAVKKQGPSQLKLREEYRPAVKVFENKTELASFQLLIESCDRTFPDSFDEPLPRIYDLDSLAVARLREFCGWVNYAPSRENGGIGEAQVATALRRGELKIDVPFASGMPSEQ